MTSERKHGKLVSSSDYRQAYDPSTGFERVCSLARQRRCLEFLSGARPRRILEIGCGSMILADMARDLALDHEIWVVVEPQAEFQAAARKAMADDPRFLIQPGFVEDLVHALKRLVPQGFDAVLLAGLLHETETPDALLKAACDLTSPGGQVLASVPNAQSFHRLLAVAAGLIPTPDTLGPRDKALGHPIVYNAGGLQDLMSRAGLTDLTFDGYLFKPFTNEQMERILSDAPHALIDGLIALGRAYPEQAAEICVTGRKPR